MSPTTPGLLARSRLRLTRTATHKLFETWSAALEWTHIPDVCVSMIEQMAAYLTWRGDEDTTDASIQEYVQMLSNKNRPAGKRALEAMRSMFASCPSRPAEKIKIKITRLAKNNIAFTEAQCQTIIGNLKLKEYKLLAHIMHECGLALVDACNLEWAHVDFSVPAIVSVRSKTRESFRVPFTRGGALWNILQEYSAERDSIYVCEWNRNRYATKTGCRCIQDGFFVAMRKSGIPEGTNTHGFRRAFVTRLVQANIHPSIIIKMTGHTSVDKLQHYARSSDEELVKAIASSHAHATNSVPVPQPNHAPLCPPVGP